MLLEVSNSGCSGNTLRLCYWIASRRQRRGRPRRWCCSDQTCAASPVPRSDANRGRAIPRDYADRSPPLAADPLRSIFERNSGVV